MKGKGYNFEIRFTDKSGKDPVDRTIMGFGELLCTRSGRIYLDGELIAVEGLDIKGIFISWQEENLTAAEEAMVTDEARQVENKVNLAKESRVEAPII